MEASITSSDECHGSGNICSRSSGLALIRRRSGFSSVARPLSELDPNGDDRHHFTGAGVSCTTAAGAGAVPTAVYGWDETGARRVTGRWSSDEGMFSSTLAAGSGQGGRSGHGSNNSSTSGRADVHTPAVADPGAPAVDCLYVSGHKGCCGSSSRGPDAMEGECRSGGSGVVCASSSCRRRPRSSSSNDNSGSGRSEGTTAVGGAEVIGGSAAKGGGSSRCSWASATPSAAPTSGKRAGRSRLPNIVLSLLHVLALAYMVVPSAGLSNLAAGDLTPDMAHFDASTGVNGLIWVDADYQLRPSNILITTGSCPLGTFTSSLTESQLPPYSTAAVMFDGAKCCAALPNGLSYNGWTSDPNSPFTVVWIGRVDGASVSTAGGAAAEKRLVSVGLYDTDDGANGPGSGGLLMSTSRTVTYSKECGNGIEEEYGGSDARPPANEWTMEVLVRNDGGESAAHHRCSQTSCLVTRALPSVPRRVGGEGLAIGGDCAGGGRVANASTLLKGEVAVVLVYGRALSQLEVQRLADLYRPRFGFSGSPVPSEPPASSPPPAHSRGPSAPLQSPPPASPLKPSVPPPPFHSPPPPKSASPPSLPPPPSPTPPHPAPASPPPQSLSASPTPSPQPTPAGKPSPPPYLSSPPPPSTPSPVPVLLPPPSAATATPTPPVLKPPPSPSPSPNPPPPGSPSSPTLPSPAHQPPNPTSSPSFLLPSLTVNSPPSAVQPPPPHEASSITTSEPVTAQRPPLPPPAVGPGSPPPHPVVSPPPPPPSPPPPTPQATPNPPAPASHPQPPPSPSSIQPPPPFPHPPPSPSPPPPAAPLLRVPSTLLDPLDGSAVLWVTWQLVVPDPLALAVWTNDSSSSGDGSSTSTSSTSSFSSGVLQVAPPPSVAASPLGGSRGTLLSSQFPGASNVRVVSVQVVVPSVQIPGQSGCSQALTDDLRDRLFAGLQQALALQASNADGNNSSSGGSNVGTSSITILGASIVNVTCVPAAAAAGGRRRQLATASQAGSSSQFCADALRQFSGAGGGGGVSADANSGISGVAATWAVSLQASAPAAAPPPPAASPPTTSSSSGGGSGVGPLDGLDFAGMVYGTLLDWAGASSHSSGNPLSTACVPLPSSYNTSSKVAVTYTAQLSEAGQEVYQQACGSGSAGSGSGAADLSTLLAAQLGLAGAASCGVDTTTTATGNGGGSTGPQAGPTSGQPALSPPAGAPSTKGAAYDSASTVPNQTGGSGAGGGSSSSKRGARMGITVGATAGAAAAIAAAGFVALAVRRRRKRQRQEQEAAATAAVDFLRPPWEEQGAQRWMQWEEEAVMAAAPAAGPATVAAESAAAAAAVRQHTGGRDPVQYAGSPFARQQSLCTAQNQSSWRQFFAGRGRPPSRSSSFQVYPNQLYVQPSPQYGGPLDLPLANARRLTGSSSMRAWEGERAVGQLSPTVSSAAAVAAASANGGFRTKVPTGFRPTAPAAARPASASAVPPPSAALRPQLSYPLRPSGRPSTDMSAPLERTSSADFSSPEPYLSYLRESRMGAPRRQLLPPLEQQQQLVLRLQLEQQALQGQTADREQQRQQYRLQEAVSEPSPLTARLPQPQAELQGAQQEQQQQRHQQQGLWEASAPPSARSAAAGAEGPQQRARELQRPGSSRMWKVSAEARAATEGNGGGAA